MEHANFGLIMAGGQGTRFWPYSTEKKPKQFLDIVGTESLILQTYRRLERFIARDNIFVVADKKYLALTMESIPGFKKANFIVEPCPRNTAPCLILANIFLSRLNDNANVLVVPADHYIPDADVYAEQMTAALQMAGQRCIITSGIKPYLPHTGYGYIQFKREEAESIDSQSFFPVSQFKEKPDLETAKQYLEEGTFYWNSGMFLYNLRHFKSFLEEYAEDYYEAYQELEGLFDSKPQFADAFARVKADSIDYALMEKVREVKMFEAQFGWNDVGSWSSVYELNKKDTYLNVNNRQNCLIDTKNSLIFSTEEKPIAVIGMENIAVIQTSEGILVAHMDQLQKVKEVNDWLKKN